MSKESSTSPYLDTDNSRLFYSISSGSIQILPFHPCLLLPSDLFISLRWVLPPKSCTHPLPSLECHKPSLFHPSFDEVDNIQRGIPT